MAGQRPSSRSRGAGNRLRPLQFIVAFGAVSMLGDFVYEGARAVVGPYLATLGAGAALVGFITGAGEAVALVLRLASGPVSDRTRRYWPLAISGYAVTMVAVPVLAAAQALWQAALATVGERFGKAVRSPARDTMLAQAGTGMGRGWAFALHEALDQSGALFGPLLVAAMVGISGYRLGFLVLAVPAALCLAVLGMLRWAVPDPGAYERAGPQVPSQAGPARPGEPAPGQPGSFSRRFWAYVAFTSLTMAGFATFGVLSYHLQVRHVVPGWQIPVIYALAMAMDALASLASGRVYDRVGLKVLLALPVLAAAVPALSFSLRPAFVWVGGVVWGAAMGVQDSTMRAAVADLVPPSRRGTGYGVFATCYGLAWLAGSTALGALYGVSLASAVAFVVVVQALALVSFAGWLARP